MTKLKLITRKDVLLKNEDLGVSLKLGRLLPEHVAEMRTMFISREDAATSISLYAMRHCMTELTNNNEFLDPVFVSYNLDVTDKDSKPFLYAVAAIITDAVLIPDADKKIHLAARAYWSGKRCAGCPGNKRRSICASTNEFIEGLTTDGCPVLLLNEYQEIFEAWKWLQDKILPSAGGYTDQSPIWQEMMQIVRSTRPHE